MDFAIFFLLIWTIIYVFYAIRKNSFYFSWHHISSVRKIVFDELSTSCVLNFVGS